jgi:hypothetical protein
VLVFPPRTALLRLQVCGCSDDERVAVLITSDRGSVATGEHIGALVGEVLERDGRLVEPAFRS